MAHAKRPSRWFSGYSPGEVQWSGSGMFDAALRDQTREVSRRRREIDDQMEMIDRARHCPRCGARSFTERKA
jgi:hypothetical protein